MSTRVYFNTSNLREHLSFQEDSVTGVGRFFFAGRQLGRCLDREGGIFYWEFHNSSICAEECIPVPLRECISRVVIVERINDEAHLAILDPGEHVDGSSKAVVRRNFSIHQNGVRYFHVEISLESSDFTHAMELLWAIQAGRRAEKPFYKRSLNRRLFGWLVG